MKDKSRIGGRLSITALAGRLRRGNDSRKNDVPLPRVTPPGNGSEKGLAAISVGSLSRGSNLGRGSFGAELGSTSLTSHSVMHKSASTKASGWRGAWEGPRLVC